MVKTGRKKRFLCVVLCIICFSVFINCGMAFNESDENSNTLTDTDFLKANGKNLRNHYGQGDVVTLRGTNAGGYLLQEMWMTPTEQSENVKDETDIYKVLTERFGEKRMRKLVGVYQKAYWTKEDFERCQDIGMNCIRLPFWYRNLVDENGAFYGYKEDAKDPYAKAFERIDWFIEEARAHGIYVILDFHGAPGSQSGSDHSGVDGGSDKVAATNFFFGEEAEKNQELFYDIWKVIAKRYQGNPAVAGYDILNEPFSSYRYNSPYTDDELHEILWDVYDKAYDTIREVDSEHVVIMEGIWNPSDLPNPEEYGWENVMYEYHQYNFGDVDNAEGKQVSGMQDKINQINNADFNVPSYIGEFTLYNNMDAWDTGLKALNDAGISWTTWTYKTVSMEDSWGLYENLSTTTRVNIETTSYWKIRKGWKKVGKCEGNAELIRVIGQNID